MDRKPGFFNNRKMTSTQLILIYIAAHIVLYSCAVAWIIRNNRK